MLFKKPYRYSEDIDFVQVDAERIGPVLDRIGVIMTPWLGKFVWKPSYHSTHLYFKFQPTSGLQGPLNLKVEINTREHGCITDFRRYPLVMESGWHSGKVSALSYSPEEIYASKLMALLGRRKQRDLYDMAYGLEHQAFDIDGTLACHRKLEERAGITVSRAMAEERMLDKIRKGILGNIPEFLPKHASFDERDALKGFERVWRQLVIHLPGSPWKLTEQTLDELRATYPGFMEEDA